jgi:2-isopropylmalate synthase
MKNQIAVLDSTLRDGAQGEGISHSVEDKLKITAALDELGVSFIEAGNPGSNPKDLEFFARLKEHKLKNARVVAFGSTRRREIAVEDDPNARALLEAGSAGVSIFGKSWDFHVKDIVKTTLDENLRMIRDTVAFFKKRGKEIIFDAEHFFDGAKHNYEYALKTLQAAAEGGANWLVLCDTNGGSFPLEVFELTKKVRAEFAVPIGIHCHNDNGMAVANTVMAVEAGASQVQGTFLGFGERCGNANLSAVIPNLQLKKGYTCIPPQQMPNLTHTARFVAEISNIILNSRLPYVGKSAFAHKGGMHIDGVLKVPHSFEHVEPEKVGNERRLLMSEVSGRSMVLKKIQAVRPELEKNSKEAQAMIDLLKEMEHKGYQYEAAESSFELLVRRHLGKYRPFFQLEKYTILDEQPLNNAGISSSATIVVTVDGKREIAAAEGDGPVNALDRALRKALEIFYPELKAMHLTDYKVRVLNPEEATAAKVRVLIESTDGQDTWATVGVSTDIIEASCLALTDSIEYKLLKDIEQRYRSCYTTEGG